MLILYLLWLQCSSFITAFPVTSVLGDSPVPFGNTTFGTTTTFFGSTGSDSSDSARRTIYTIIQTCFFTFVASVYRAVHPNIPNPHASFFRLIWEKIVITFYMVLFPDFVLLWAIGQLYGARHVANVVNKKFPGIDWTIVHGHVVQMGGFGRSDNHYAMSANDFVKYVEDGRISQESLDVSAFDLEDHSKGDGFSKGASTLQIAWFIAQCVVRHRKGLYLTQLEVSTLAFAGISVIAYLVWWKKPLNARCIIYIDIIGQDAQLDDTHSSIESDSETDIAFTIAIYLLVLICLPPLPFVMIFLNAATMSQGYHLHNPHPRLQPFLSKALFQPHNCVDRFSQYKIDRFGGGTWKFGVAKVILGTLFGAVHILSWNSLFLTPQAQFIWRASTVYLIVICPTFPVLFFLMEYFKIGHMSNLFMLALIMWMFFWYSFARGSLIVQSLLLLRDLPPNAFIDVQWIQLIPHL